MRTQTFTQHFNASPAALYSAHLNPDQVKIWKVPDEMTMKIHTFEPKIDGRFRISLTYMDSSAGKSGEHTDTYHGYFKELIPNEKIVEVLEFESDDPQLTGRMTITTTFTPENSGTKLISTHENLPAAVPEDQNEAGWKISLNKLAKLVQ